MTEHAYIHIPFCKSKCFYCSFISGENIKNKQPYLNALLSEIKTRYKNELLKTIYFGGGTPSLLNYQDLENILNCFNYDKTAEITLEANPETLTLRKLQEYKKTGINRISLGVQTFNDEILKLTGRNHDEKSIISAIKNIKEAGFKNISIDLIYGLPKQNIKLLEKDLIKAINLEVQHISTYGLKIENNSFFGKNPPDNLPDCDLQAEMYLFLCEFLKEYGYNHYEISNFSKQGYNSIHNCAYWNNKNYYGFGVNASGFENNLRYKNISDFKKYISNPFLKEEEYILTQKEIIEDEIFLALRLQSGVNINEINNKYNIDFEEKYKEIIKKYNKLDLTEIFNGHYRLKEKGMLLSNEIMSEFIEIN